MLSVLVMSCDLYNDTWKPFNTLYNKYFSNDFKTYICTETIECPYFETIKKQGQWTKRLREALQELDSKYVLLLLDDFFIHEYVDQERIYKVLELFEEDTAVFNFELKYRKCESDMGSWSKQFNNQVYLNSCQPSIHDRLKLLKRLDKDQTAWEWETTLIDSPHKFYINNKTPIIDIGYNINHEPWGVVQGKWSRETKELFDREGIDIDYEKRGFYN